MYYVAAAETMKKSLLTKIWPMQVQLSVERTWRAEGQDVKRQSLKMSDISSIGKLGMTLGLITFPQGTLHLEAIT